MALGEDDQLVLQRRHVAKSGTSLVVRPEVFAVGIENYRADRDFSPAALFYLRGRLVQLAEQELVKVRLAETGAGKYEAAA